MIVPDTNIKTLKTPNKLKTIMAFQLQKSTNIEEVILSTLELCQELPSSKIWIEMKKSALNNFTWSEFRSKFSQLKEQGKIVLVRKGFGQKARSKDVYGISVMKSSTTLKNSLMKTAIKTNNDSSTPKPEKQGRTRRNWLFFLKYRYIRFLIETQFVNQTF